MSAILDVAYQTSSFFFSGTLLIVFFQAVLGLGILPDVAYQRTAGRVPLSGSIKSPTGHPAAAYGSLTPNKQSWVPSISGQ